MADIQLSSQLFQDIQTAVARQHPDADQGTIMQYLAAVMGYMLGSQRSMDSTQKEAFLDELFEFSKHVLSDMQQQSQQKQAQPSQQAFGYWEPPKQG